MRTFALSTLKSRLTDRCREGEKRRIAESNKKEREIEKNANKLFINCLSPFYYSSWICYAAHASHCG